MRPSQRRLLGAAIAALMEGKREHTATPRELAHELRQRERDVIAALKTLQAEDLAAPVAGGRWWKLLPKAEEMLREGRRRLVAEGIA